jgi:hypothetical protein
MPCEFSGRSERHWNLASFWITYLEEDSSHVVRRHIAQAALKEVCVGSN